MIQQIIYINSWESLENLLIQSERIPLFNAKADLFTSPFSKKFLTTDGHLTTKSGEFINQNFDRILLPDLDLSISDFLSDISRIPTDKNVHIVILLDLNESAKLDVKFAIEQATINFINLTFLLLDINDNFDANEFRESLQGNSIFLGEFKTHQKQCFLKVALYQDGNTRLENKLFVLSDDGKSHPQRGTLPVLISSQAASREFLKTHGFHSFEAHDFPKSVLETSNEAVVVLPCRGFDDIRPVAKIILDNKNLYGDSIHFVVKELSPCIRYSDFHMLITAGAQSIVEHNRNEAALYDQIRLASITQMEASYLTEQSLFEQFESPVRESGFVSYSEFKSITLNAIELCQNTQIEYALVELIPYSSVPLNEVVSYSKMKRRGDIACQIDGRVLIFFSSLRRYEIHQALLNVFAVSPSELFIDEIQLTTAETIINRLSNLQAIDYLDKSETDILEPDTTIPMSRYAKPVDWDDV
ncbi:BcsE family c-di-GMP-binding protein [Vibrio maritimus]|uniref:BcsE family c-di-GMP-binding protein n=1 Tax=Vibrio maritimus TaxID=990268 RepID=UPI00406772F3